MENKNKKHCLLQTFKIDSKRNGEKKAVQISNESIRSSPAPVHVCSKLQQSIIFSSLYLLFIYTLKGAEERNVLLLYGKRFNAKYFSKYIQVLLDLKTFGSVRGVVCSM